MFSNSATIVATTFARPEPQDVSAVLLATPGKFTRPIGAPAIPTVSSSSSKGFQDKSIFASQNSGLNVQTAVIQETGRFKTNPFPQTQQTSNVQKQEPFGVFEPMNLPSGASDLLGQIDTSFSCIDKPYGYYADQANDCRLFHICYPALFPDGRSEIYQYR